MRATHTHLQVKENVKPGVFGFPFAVVPEAHIFILPTFHLIIFAFCEQVTPPSPLT